MLWKKLRKLKVAWGCCLDVQTKDNMKIGRGTGLSPPFEIGSMATEVRTPAFLDDQREALLMPVSALVST